MVTWCVQQKQPIPIWRNLFLLCNDPLVFITFGILCIIVLSMIYFIQQFEDKQPKWDLLRHITDGICVFCCFSCEYRPQIISIRIVFAFFVLGCIIFNISNFAFWMKIVEIQYYEKQIETVQQIVNSFHLVGDEFALEHVKRQNNVGYSIM